MSLIDIAMALVEAHLGWLLESMTLQNIQDEQAAQMRNLHCKYLFRIM
jgi:hypothetical protein